MRSVATFENEFERVRAARLLRYVPRAAAACALLSAGCRCEQNEQPYTPFGRATATITESSAPSGSSTGAPPVATFARESARAVEPPERRVELDGLVLEAAEGQLLARVLPFRRDGTRLGTALGWAIPAEAGTDRSPGELLLFASEAPPRKLLGFPAFVPTLAGCQHRVELVRTGDGSATLDVRADCPGAGLPDRTPTRAVLVVAPEREPALIHGLRLAEGFPDETFDVAVDSRDVDGDGHDDVSASFSLARGSDAEAVEAKVVWFSRAAGVGRDSTWPAKSFADIGSIELVRASGRNTSERVAGRVQNARRLAAHLCSEAGSPRVSDDEARPIACGDLEQARDLLAQAEVKGLLTRGLLGEAALVAEIADWYGPISEAAAKKLRDELARALPEVAATPSSIDARPRDPGPQGTFSPLAFASDGTLLLQTLEGLVRLRDGELHDASSEVDPWPLVESGPRGQTWLGLSLPCEKPLVELQGRSADGAFQTLLAGRWLAPRPSQCSGRTDLGVPPVRLVRWDARGIGVLFGAAFWGSEEALLAPSLGSPVSPNGKHWVAATRFGLFVQHETSSERWNAPGLERVERCVIGNDGTRVACVQRGAVLLLEKQAEKPRPTTD